MTTEQYQNGPWAGGLPRGDLIERGRRRRRRRAARWALAGAAMVGVAAAGASPATVSLTVAPSA